ncbi:MAG: hypothetical protein U0169_01010 [Polyangiaceae bacterium]
MRTKAWQLAVGIGVAVATLEGVAHADRVLVLPFGTNGTATSTLLAEARTATQDAVVLRRHTLPSAVQVAAGTAAVHDGVADVREEFRSAGRAAASDWTITGHVDSHGETYRVDLEVCQVDTGRVESLAREITPKRSASQIAEMLGHLLRAEGIGNGEVTWSDAPPPNPSHVGATTNGSPSSTSSPSPTSVPTPPPLPPAPEPPSAPKPYAARRPFAVGIDLTPSTAVARPAGAVGSPAALYVGVHGGYAFEDVTGFEVRAEVSGSVAGPSALRVAGSARYLLQPKSTFAFYLGPELAAGTFVTLGGDKRARFLLAGRAVFALGLGERFQVEAVPDVTLAAGGTSNLVLVGGSVRGAVRF